MLIVHEASRIPERFKERLKLRTACKGESARLHNADLFQSYKDDQRKGFIALPIYLFFLLYLVMPLCLFCLFQMSPRRHIVAAETIDRVHHKTTAASLPLTGKTSYATTFHFRIATYVEVSPKAASWFRLLNLQRKQYDLAGRHCLKEAKETEVTYIQWNLSLRPPEK